MTTNDLVTRLRAMADGQHDDHSIGDEAADEIEWLTDKLERVRATERARCIRAIQWMPVPIDQADGAMRAIAAIEALNETKDTP